MKRIIALLMAVAIIGSSLIFCYADAELKIDTRLEYDDQGNANLVFSIPKKSRLKELNLDLSYFFLAMVIEPDTNVSFESNLSPEEEQLMEWNVITDRDELMMYEANTYSHCFIDGYFTGEKGLVEGGDLFTLKFKVHDCINDDTFDFKFKFNYLASKDDNTVFTVPETLNYTTSNHNVISFSTAYNTYIPSEAALTLIGDYTKLTNDGDEYTDNSTNDGTNFYGYPVGNYMANTAGGIGPWGVIFAQSFLPANEYISGCLLNLHIDNDPANTNVTGGEAVFVIQFTDDYKNNTPQTVIGSKHWSERTMAGGSAVFTMGVGDDIVCLSTAKTHYIKFGYYSPTRMRNTYVSLYSASTSYPMIVSGNGNWSSDAWTTQTNKRMYFKITYDQDAINFITYAKNNCGGTPDYNTSTLNIINTGAGYLNKLSQTKKNVLQAYSGSKTYYNNYSTYYTKYYTYEGYVNEFKNKVNAISTVTANSSSAITAAENYYNSYITTSGMKSAVTSQKSTLESKRRIYDAIAAINAIGTVTLSDASYVAINNAQAKYNALTSDTERKAVTNYSTLTAAHTKYADLEKANAVIAKISAIGSPVAWNNSSKVTEARNAYNDLTSTQKGYVSNYSTLTTAETRITNMTNDKNTLITAVNNLGALKYDNAYQTRLQTARNALNKIISYDDAGLLSAVSTQKSAIETAEAKIQQMQKNVQNVIDLIDAIGTVTFTEQCANKIQAAQSAYDALQTAEEKAAVSNYGKLKAAHVAYAILSLENPATWSSKDRVNEVYAAYNNLSTTEKSYIPTSVQNTIKNAKTRIDNMTADKEALQTAVNNLGELKYTNAYQTRLQTARNALNKIISYDDAGLLSAVSTQKSAIEEAEGKIQQMQKNVQNVIDLIDSIGNVTFTSACADKINAAQAAYEALKTPEEKAAVSNISILQAAHTKFADLNAVEIVKAEIDKIGSPVTWGNRSQVTAAVNAYNGLTATQLSYFPSNYLTILTAAEKYIADLGTMRQNFINAVNALPSTIDYNDASKNALKKANDEYAFIAKVSDQSLWDSVSTEKAKLDAAQERYNEIENDVLTVKGLIEQLYPYLNNPAILQQGALLEAAVYGFNVTLTDGGRTWLQNNTYNGKTYFQILTLANNEFNYRFIANEFDNKVAQLPDPVTWKDKDTVRELNAEYEGYANEIKQYITKNPTLNTAVSEINRLQGLIDTFVTAVNNIPSDDKLTINDVSKITAARNAYNAIVATNDTALINDSTVVTYLNKLLASEVRNVELLIDYIFDSINIDADDLTPGEDVVLSRYTAKRNRYDVAKKAFDALSSTQKTSVRNAYKLDMANYEFNVDDNFIELYEVAGLEGKKLNHTNTDAGRLYDNALIAVTAFNGQYGAAPYNYKYSYMIIPEANLPLIENEIKIIEGFDSCTKAWVENGRHTDPSDFDTSYYDNVAMGQDVRNDPVTNDSQTSVYFQVQPQFLKPKTDSETTILGFNTQDDFGHCAVDTSLFSETTLGLQQTVPYEGAGALQMNMGAPTKETQLVEGEMVKVGGQFYYNFDTPVDLSGYNSFKFNFYTPVALQGQGGQMRVNFITDSGSSDGFNFVIEVCYAYTGWNTYTISNKLKPDDTVAGADWTKIRRISFTWFNIDSIIPKDDYGNCFFIFDNLCGLNTSWVDDSVTLENGVKTSVYFHENLLPVNTKITLVELVNSTTKRFYGYTVNSIKNEIFLDDFVQLETKSTGYSALNTYATAKSLTGRIENGMSFIMIFDFSETANPTTSSTLYGRLSTISINIFNRAEYNDANILPYSTVYSIKRTYIKTGNRRELSITANNTSNTSITKNGNITFSGTYSVSDVGTVNYTFDGVADNGHKAEDTFSQNKTISIMAKIKDSKGNYVPVDELIINSSSVSGITYKGKGSDCFYFTAGDANATVTNKAFSFTVNFANCKVLPIGTYTLELTISRVSNANGALGYVNDVTDIGKETTSTTFNVNEVPKAGLNVVFESLNGNANTKFIDTTKNNTLLVDIKHINAQNYNLAITIQKKNSDGSYSDLTTSTFITATTSRTISTNSSTKIDETITLKGTQFNKGSTYRLVFTLSSDNTKIVRYLNLLTVPE